MAKGVSDFKLATPGRGTLKVKGAPMAKRKVIHVVYKKNDGKWELRGGDGRFTTKTRAVAAGKKQAKGAELGQLVIHKKTGGIQTEHTYGSDPRRKKG
jgi:hypothetical protein